MLEKIFLKKTQDPADPAVRAKCGRNAGILGIVLNTLLAAGKIAVGAISGAISVTADGLNNLTDCGSNVVSVIGFKMSEKPADKEHPFGHRRAESVASLLIAVIILVVAVELVVQSVEKIFSPSDTDFSRILIGVLIASVLVKLFMFFFNRSLGKALSSETLKATAADSISDVIATAAVLISALISRFTHLETDAYLGIVVALFIAFTGLSILKETVSGLLGKAPDPETVHAIQTRVLSFDEVRGLHDLTVHNYGQNKLYATVHVEVDSGMGLTAAHDLADRIEKNFSENTDVALTVHIDPLVYDDPELNRLREEVVRIVKDVDETLRMHDFRLVGGETHKNLVFDVAVPFECKLSDAEIASRIREQVLLLNGNYDAVTTIERQNID
mgnify:CR=1 FL=1